MCGPTAATRLGAVRSRTPGLPPRRRSGEALKTAYESTISYTRAPSAFRISTHYPRASTLPPRDLTTQFCQRARDCQQGQVKRLTARARSTHPWLVVSAPPGCALAGRPTRLISAPPRVLPMGVGSRAGGQKGAAIRPSLTALIVTCRHQVCNATQEGGSASIIGTGERKPLLGRQR